MMVMGRPRVEVDLERVTELRAQGLSWERIAAELGVHRNTLRGALSDSRVVRGVSDEKKCGGCRQVLALEEFSVDRSRRDGRNIKCRGCCSAQWKQNNSSSCVDCGNPRMSPTPGQCRRCYQMTALLKRTEFEAISIIPNLIHEAGRETRELIKTLSESKELSSYQRLQMLIAQVANGNARNIETEA